MTAMYIDSQDPLTGRYYRWQYINGVARWCLGEVSKDGLVVGVELKIDCVCTKCNTLNEYAEPNQKDGTYLCFECR